MIGGNLHQERKPDFLSNGHAGGAREGSDGDVGRERRADCCW
jgi:hypothetical protein